MSEIGSAQLHSELFRRRHSTRQSRGLFALAKRLYETVTDIKESVSYAAYTSHKPVGGYSSYLRYRYRVCALLDVASFSAAQHHCSLAGIIQLYDRSMCVWKLYSWPSDSESDTVTIQSPCKTFLT